MARDYVTDSDEDANVKNTFDLPEIQQMSGITQNPTRTSGFLKLPRQEVTGIPEELGEERDVHVTQINSTCTLSFSKLDIHSVLSTDNFFSASESNQTVLCSGWLTKQGKNVKMWKRRYCELTPSQLIYYTQKGGQEKGTIPVEHITGNVAITNEKKITSVQGTLPVLNCLVIPTKGTFLQHLEFICCQNFQSQFHEKNSGYCKILYFLMNFTSQREITMHLRTVKKRLENGFHVSIRQQQITRNRRKRKEKLS